MREEVRALCSPDGAQPGSTFQSESPRIVEYAIAAAIFGVSRLLVFLAILFSVRFILPSNLPGAWNEGSSLWHYLLRWDSGWYLAIMRDGYHYLPDASIQQTVAFFPLYPALSWCVARIFQLQFSTAALIVSNAASIACRFIALQLCARTLRGADRVWRRYAIEFVSGLDFSLRGIFRIARDGADDGGISRSGPIPLS